MQRCVHGMGLSGQDNGEPMNFRYSLKGRARVHTYEPKVLGADVDLKALRPTQLGATLMDSMHKFSPTKICGIVWDVVALD